MRSLKVILNYKTSYLMIDESRLRICYFVMSTRVQHNATYAKQGLIFTPHQELEIDRMKKYISVVLIKKISSRLVIFKWNVYYC